MTWRIWSPVGSTSSSNASFETSSVLTPRLLLRKERKQAAFRLMPPGVVSPISAGGSERRLVRKRRSRHMSERMITLELSHADAEILLGVLAAERYNKEAEAVCDALRKQLDEKLAAPGTGCPLQA